jgi:hypothetical protein
MLMETEEHQRHVVADAEHVAFYGCPMEMGKGATLLCVGGEEQRRPSGMVVVVCGSARYSLEGVRS